MKVLAFIPARSGSKSIDNKNMALLGGEHLITYCIEAVKRSSITDIICSTDNEPIANLARRKGLTVLDRPRHLAKDDTPVSKVISHFIRNHYQQDEVRHDAIALVQPTSPFLTPYQIEACIKMLSDNPDMMSVQTICRVPHNFHAWNQRILSKKERTVEWAYPQREWAINKQAKPALFKFGNLVVTRLCALDRGDIFAKPSGGIETSIWDSIDVDTQDDLDLANALVETGHLGLWKREL